MTKDEDNSTAPSALQSTCLRSFRLATPTVLNWAVKGVNISERAKNASWSNTTIDEAKPPAGSEKPSDSAPDKPKIDRDSITGVAADAVRLQTPAILNWSVSGRDAAERSRHATWSDMANDSKPLPTSCTANVELRPAEPGPVELLEPQEAPVLHPRPHPTLALDLHGESTSGNSMRDVPRTDSASRERRRLEPVVELPSIYKRNQVTVKVELEPMPSRIAEFDADPLQQMGNPMVKVKEELKLEFSSIEDRLSEAGISLQPNPLDIEKELLNFAVPRKFISYLYGGSTQSAVPHIAPGKVAEHGLNDFMFLNPTYNPHVPTSPGAGGLYFSGSSQDADPRHGIKRVFVRVRSNEWLYFGQYDLPPSRSHTKEEWLSQKPIVRRTRARHILKNATRRIIRQRIILRRKLGREPTQEQCESLEGDNDITVEEIMDALDQGLEFMAVWCLKFVTYDIDFQRNLFAKYPAWARRNEATGESRQKSNKAKKGPKALMNTRKRKRGDSHPSVNGERDPLSDERYDQTMEENGEEFELVYRPRGTRSRPLIA